MIIITTIYTTIYTIIYTYIYTIYKKKKEESKEERRNIEAFLRPIFSFFLIIIMKNMYLKGEGDFEYEGEMKSACQCIVPKCRNCQPRFYQLRPHRVIEL